MLCHILFDLSAWISYSNIYRIGRLIALPHTLGKITAESIREFCETYRNDGNHEHMVAPGMVYISQPTEYGTLYSLRELNDIKEVCKKYNMPLSMWMGQGSPMGLPVRGMMCCFRSLPVLPMFSISAVRNANAQGTFFHIPEK